jgi:hypothetical protein
MKKILALAGMAILAVASVAQADSDVDALLAALRNPHVVVDGQDLNDLGYLINWKVGDGANYNVTMAQLPFPGTMTKSVTKDEGTTLWFNETIDLVIQKQSVDIQMDKTNGKILQELVNGQAQTVDNTPPTIISQDYGSVTVPAGTFKAIHIVAKTTENNQDVQMEEWANPKDTCMDGSIKVIMTTQGQTITMEMTSFKKN